MRRSGADWILVAIVFSTLAYWFLNVRYLTADLIVDRQLQITRESIDEALTRARLGTPEFSRALRAVGARKLGVAVPQPSALDTDPRYLANFADLIRSGDHVVIFEPMFDTKSEYPFTVAVINNSGSVECTGIVLDTNRVLTLDHCRNIKGVVEENQVHSSSKVIGVKRSKPFRVGGETELGLCILFTSKSLSAPACARADSTEVDAATKNLTAVGYGLTEITQASSPGSRATAVFTVTSNACNGTSNALPNGIPDASQFGCKAGKELVAKADLVKGGTCKGDSGGPLLLKRTDGTFAVAGLTRRAIDGIYKCGRESIFVRIDDTDSKNWIRTTTSP